MWLQVELKCLEATSAGYYYPDQLPNLGERGGMCWLKGGIWYQVTFFIGLYYSLKLSQHVYLKLKLSSDKPFSPYFTSDEPSSKELI